MLRKDWIYRRGDVYLGDLDTRVGAVEGGRRPVIVLQNNYGNFSAPTLMVVPLTANIGKISNLPTYYRIENDVVLYPSIVLIEQLTTIDKKQIRRYVGRISCGEMNEIGKRIEMSLGMNIPEEPKKYLPKKSVSKKSMRR